LYHSTYIFSLKDLNIFNKTILILTALLLIKFKYNKNP